MQVEINDKGKDESMGGTHYSPLSLLLLHVYFAAEAVLVLVGGVIGVLLLVNRGSPGPGELHKIN